MMWKKFLKLYMYGLFLTIWKSFKTYEGILSPNWRISTHFKMVYYKNYACSDTVLIYNAAGSQHDCSWSRWALCDKKNLFIYSGETYSVLVKADQDPSRNYWVTTSEVSRNNTVTPPGLAILNYYPNHPKKSPPTVPPAGPLWNDVEPLLNQSRAIKAHHDYIVPPPHTSTSPTSPT